MVVEGARALVAHLPRGAGGQQLLVDLHEPLVGRGDGRPGTRAVELGRQQLLALRASLGGQQPPGHAAVAPPGQAGVEGRAQQLGHLGGREPVAGGHDLGLDEPAEPQAVEHEETGLGGDGHARQGSRGGSGDRVLSGPRARVTRRRPPAGPPAAGARGSVGTAARPWPGPAPSAPRGARASSRVMSSDDRPCTQVISRTMVASGPSVPPTASRPSQMNFSPIGTTDRSGACHWRPTTTSADAAASRVQVASVRSIPRRPFTLHRLRVRFTPSHRPGRSRPEAGSAPLCRPRPWPAPGRCAGG